MKFSKRFDRTDIIGFRTAYIAVGFVVKTNTLRLKKLFPVKSMLYERYVIYTDEIDYTCFQVHNVSKEMFCTFIHTYRIFIYVH